MISLQIAEKLKKLEWTPQINDCVYIKSRQGVIIEVEQNNKSYIITADFGKYKETGSHEFFTWAPRFDQLIDKVEKLGYLWNLDSADQKYRSEKYLFILYKGEDYVRDFSADTIEDAIALALMWLVDNECELNFRGDDMQ